ncbi:toll/interleukin-1 receptor domain-containing protein [Rhodococcus opacus]|nr:toll/interleukin-1 receptor domain-containing protein [Rhodococcus opacus]
MPSPRIREGYDLGVTSAEGKHVFISYVKEDQQQVDQLCKILDAAQIPYWRDRTSLAPGDNWKAKIRDAIRSGALIFLACFSDNSRARPKTVMNEELTLAVEEFRQMAPGVTWLIPVRFDDGKIPGWDLGAGRVLGDLNYVDLFGANYT